MRSKISLGYVLAGLVALFGCLSENDSLDRCEPCPSGFSCVETPFGTHDCLPDAVQHGDRADGRLFQPDMSEVSRFDADSLVNGSNDTGMDLNINITLPYRGSTSPYLRPHSTSGDSGTRKLPHRPEARRDEIVGIPLYRLFE